VGGSAEVGCLGRIGEGKEGTGNAQPPKQQNEAKTKQMPKATSEEENKSQQTLGLRKQKSIED